MLWRKVQAKWLFICLSKEDLKQNSLGGKPFCYPENADYRQYILNICNPALSMDVVVEVSDYSELHQNPVTGFTAVIKHKLYCRI